MRCAQGDAVIGSSIKVDKVVALGGAGDRNALNNGRRLCRDDTGREKYRCVFPMCGCLTASDGKFGCPNGQDAYDGKLIIWTRR